MSEYEVTPPDRLADRVQLRTAFSTERGEVTRSERKPTPFRSGSERQHTPLPHALRLVWMFHRFRETTEEIARLQSKLPEGRYSSNRIRRLYQKRTRRRDHAQETLCRDLLDQLYAEGIAIVYVGDLTDVLGTHWCADVNAKTHQFWAFRAFIDPLSHTAEEYGITVEEESEADTTRTCPACGEQDATDRDGDVFRCPCGHEAHADLCASRTFLERQAGKEVGSMARPVRLKWDDHNWSEIPHSPERVSPNEKRTNQSTGNGKLASVGTA